MKVSVIKAVATRENGRWERLLNMLCLGTLSLMLETIDYGAVRKLATGGNVRSGGNERNFLINEVLTIKTFPILWDAFQH